GVASAVTPCCHITNAASAVTPSDTQTWLPTQQSYSVTRGCGRSASSQRLSTAMSHFRKLERAEPARTVAKDANSLDTDQCQAKLPGNHAIVVQRMPGVFGE